MKRTMRLWLHGRLQATIHLDEPEPALEAAVEGLIRELGSAPRRDPREVYAVVTGNGEFQQGACEVRP